MSTALRYAVVVLLAAASLLWRDYNLNTFLAPGVELVTVLAVVSAILLPRVVAVAVPLLTVAVGDLVLGSHSVIFLYVWGAWVVIAIAALVMRRDRSRTATALVGLGIGAGASTLFFLVTNLGTWMLGRGEWYADSFAGLLTAYGMGLPFYLYPLAANLVLVPAAAVAAHALRGRLEAPAAALQPAH
ncbi:DUF6580 family putative transport protein [Pseudactinotalea sp. HY158]|uniref:DUF6580 family putative transport protein n=1 Tax=Pseudactinotalea sp. HY158 TaxID=2654547 RepID=UPI00129C8C0F|nr:DUF6580 family putative transport protein [Pseudactinotalea sp. HY158]QGH68195.1 hypothetical protein GCE65_00675 [Pseudactinotalea sp. HY158]